MFLIHIIISIHNLVKRDNLQSELERLSEEQRHMENDLSNIEIRWLNLKEEKLKATNVLQRVKKLEEELEHLTEENTQVDLDEKVSYYLIH